MPNTELAEELLQLEEADAWFEYLESTLARSRRGMPSLSLGPGRVSHSASARSTHGAHVSRPAAA